MQLKTLFSEVTRPSRIQSFITMLVNEILIVLRVRYRNEQDNS